jgi:sugar O-acyltransferase (sialic acid O-acetyltransferase NeuD family)
MIHFIGNGGHSKVIADLVDAISAAGYNYHTVDAWIVAVGNNRNRRKEALLLGDKPCAVLIHPSAYVAHSAHIGGGSVVMAGAVVQPDAVVGRHCIINSGATVDHDAVVADYAHIAPGAHLCGGVKVGEGALVGVGVGIEPGVVIPAWSIVKREAYVVTVPSH